ncbi:MAG: response regulator transcription factor [Cyanobacteria bacterium J06560_2]
MVENLSVLIIEDDPMMRLGLQYSLAAQTGIAVMATVEAGEEGLALVDQSVPDLVVMDIGLPGLDGIATTQRLKANYPRVQVVILTSHTADTEIVAALASGADAYCVKGTSVEQLMRAIVSIKEGGTYLDAAIAQTVITQLQGSNQGSSKDSGKPSAPPTIIGQLSTREMEVLQLIVEGYSNPEIGAQLYLSTNTVKTHVKGIMNKLAVNDRVQAAVVALRSGLVL